MKSFHISKNGFWYFQHFDDHVKKLHRYDCMQRLLSFSRIVGTRRFPILNTQKLPKGFENFKLGQGSLKNAKSTPKTEEKETPNEEDPKSIIFIILSNL